MDDGFYDGVIMGARVIFPHYPIDGHDEAREIEFKVGVYDANRQPLAQGTIYLEYSTRYGQGNRSQQMQWQITEDDMKKLGYQFGSDFSKLSTLVNQPCRVNYATKDKNGVPFKSGPKYYFAFKREVKEVEGDVNAVMAAIRNGAAAAPAPAPAPAAAGFGGFPAPAAAPVPGFPGAAAAPAPAPAPAAPGFPGFPQ